MKQLKVIISGGGTGGHIFPAIAIANALKAINPLTEILFVGAEGRMEMEKVPAAGYKIESLWISGLQRKLTLANLSFPFKVIASIYKARKIVKKFDPDVVVGTGGYASGPTLKVATNLGIPCLIQEQNSYPGITNKLLSKRVDKICVAYSNMDKFFPREKIILTGNPVRQDILNTVGKKDRAFEFFNLDSDKKVVLVIGGSLGARTINKTILRCLPDIQKAGIQLIWQTGKTFYTEALEASKLYSNVKVFEFLSKMDYAYAAADVIVSRAGASSISELCLVGKPVILIPSPNVAEDHQTKNAMALVNHNAALLVTDKEAENVLLTVLIDLINNESKKENLKHQISSLGFTDSASVIANEVIRLANSK